MKECGAYFNHDPGDGHCRSASGEVCARLAGHGDVGHRSRWSLTSLDEQEIAEAKAEEGRRFREFIRLTAVRYDRRRAAEAELDRLLQLHPEEEFTITVPVQIMTARTDAGLRPATESSQ